MDISIFSNLNSSVPSFDSIETLRSPPSVSLTATTFEESMIDLNCLKVAFVTASQCLDQRQVSVMVKTQLLKHQTLEMRTPALAQDQ